MAFLLDRSDSELRERLTDGAFPVDTVEGKLLAIELAARGPREGSTTRPPVCEWALSEPNAGLRARAAAACTATDSPDRLWFDRVTGDGSFLVRARLARALVSRSGEEDAARRLSALAEDPHPTVRAAARRVTQYQECR